MHPILFLFSILSHKAPQMLKVHEQLYIPSLQIPGSAQDTLHHLLIMQIVSQIISPFQENNIKMPWFALFIWKMQISLLLSQFVSCFKYQTWCERWQNSLLQLRVSTHSTLCYLAVLQIQQNRHHAVAHCQVLNMYQPREGLSSPHLPWYWALNPFRRWLLSDVKCNRSQFLLLMTGDGRFMPVSLEWGKVAEFNEQNRQ